ncbi:MAG: phosphoribosylamine--glycine ligase, partial [Candidatus Dormibacteria bacterium]
MSARPGGLHVLVIGSGGREHALAWAAAHSPLVERVSCAPGNAGTAQLGDNHDLAATDVTGLVELARAEHVDLVVVGPDAAVAAGVSDGLVLAGVPCFGPSQAAGRLEGSKTFAKELLAELGIATPGFVSFDRLPAALDHLRGRRGPVVVKADGLALGKGVFVCADPDEAATVAERLLQGGELGEAGSRILIEDCVHGQEASFFAICDGRQARMLPPARDYKRAEDGELGPNTGGMGSYAPAGSGWRELNRQVHDLVVLPVLEAMARRGHPYRGCLYVGAMVLEGQ